jgi:hypothetical protein
LSSVVAALYATTRTPIRLRPCVLFIVTPSNS